MIAADPALPAPAPAPAAAPASARALIEAQMAMLSRLAQMGMDIAEAVRRDVCDAGPDPAPNPDQGAPPHPTGPAPRSPDQRRHLALVFARVARAVRLTIALQSRLAKDLAALDKEAAWAEDDRRRDRRLRLGGLVREAAKTLVVTRRQAEGDSMEAGVVEAEIELLSGAAYERLTEAEDGWLVGRPFDQVVARICRDLGMTPDAAARLTAMVAAPPQDRAAPPAEPPPDPASPPPSLAAPAGGAQAFPAQAFPAWTEPAARPRAPP